MTFTRWYSSYFYSLIVFEPYSLLRKYPLNNASIIAFKTSKLIKKKMDSYHMEKTFEEIHELFR